MSRVSFVRVVRALRAWHHHTPLIQKPLIQLLNAWPGEEKPCGKRNPGRARKQRVEISCELCSAVIFALCPAFENGKPAAFEWRVWIGLEVFCEGWLAVLKENPQLFLLFGC